MHLNSSISQRAALWAVLAALPGIALGSPYDGTYRQVANADCALVGVDGGAVRVADGIFYGVGMECRMTRPVDVVNMTATLYTMQCSGTDAQWTERTMVMAAADGPGIIMLWDGYAFRYDRCAEPAASDPSVSSR